MFRLILDGKVLRAPLERPPARVLDVGTGDGIWAMDFADEFPTASIIGTDLSPIQPTVRSLSVCLIVVMFAQLRRRSNLIRC